MTLKDNEITFCRDGCVCKHCGTDYDGNSIFCRENPEPSVRLPKCTCGSIQVSVGRHLEEDPCDRPDPTYWVYRCHVCGFEVDADTLAEALALWEKGNNE